jgi:heat shock protein HtpX
LLLAAGIVLGLTGAFLLLAAAVVAVSVRGQMPLHTILRMRGAVPVSAYQAPALHGLLDELARRAELPARPALYFVARPEPEAFTVASGDAAAIVVSRGVLDVLDRHELAGVLAHEVSHVKARDSRLLALMHAMRQLTGSVVLVGVMAVLFSLLGLFPPVSPLVPLLLVLPGMSMAATLAVSRTREFDADLGAAALLGDPEPLARALHKLERIHSGLLGTLGIPAESIVPPSLRTHPPTRERVQRLMALLPSRRRRAPWPAGPARRAVLL